MNSLTHFLVESQFCQQGRQRGPGLDVCTLSRESIPMLRANIVREIQALPFQEQFEMLEYLARSLRQQSQAQACPGTAPGTLTAAAEALRCDYQNDPELTAFTALDCEDFHAAR